MWEWSWHTSILSYKLGICLGGAKKRTKFQTDSRCPGIYSDQESLKQESGMLITHRHHQYSLTIIGCNYVYRSTCNIVIQYRSVARQHTSLQLSILEKIPHHVAIIHVLQPALKLLPRSFSEPFIQTVCRLSLLLCTVPFKLSLNRTVLRILRFFTAQIMRLYAFLLASLHTISSSTAQHTNIVLDVARCWLISGVCSGLQVTGHHKTCRYCFLLY